MTWLLVTRRPLWPSFGALGLFPGIHIAQFPFQVIGNCGVISLMQCSNRRKVKAKARRRAIGTKIKVRIVWLAERPRQLSVGDAHSMTVSWRRRCATVSTAARGELPA